MGTMGRVERQMNDTGGDLKAIKVAVNIITAHLMSSSNRHEGSVLTAYADDDRAVWKEFRRELLEDGFSSSVLRKHKRLIKAYIEELGSRGLFDEEGPNMDAEEHYYDVHSPVERAMAYNPETENILKASSEILMESEAESEAESVVESVVESPVESTPQPDFDNKPNTASHSETELPDRERPINDTIPEIHSQPKPKPEMRWIWFSNEKPERDENATRPFHDMWHELYDNIVQRFIEWGCLPFHERRQTDLSTFIDRVSQLRARLKRLPLPEHLSGSRKDLLRGIVHIGKCMEEHRMDHPLIEWTDKRSSGLGYQVRFHSIEYWNPYRKVIVFGTGPGICSQLDTNGVCRQGQMIEGGAGSRIDRSKGENLVFTPGKKENR